MEQNKELHPLTLLWLDRIQQEESLRFEDLRPYSKIQLRKSRSRKKFKKRYARYLSKRAFQAWIGAISATPMVITFIKTFDLNIDPQMVGQKLPGVSLYYLDFKYEQTN